MIAVKQVFVVDLDRSARSGLISLLTQAGYDARGFSSSAEFRDAFESETCGCLVLDAEAAAMGHQGLLKEFEERGLRMPIIIVSADYSELDLRAAHDLEAVGLFRKPVDGVALLDAVRWALEPIDGA